jgi:hypothetical protein
MYFMRQIEAIAKFKYVPSAAKPYNCDKTMATMECEISSKEDEMLTVQSESDATNKRQRRVFRNIGGRIVEQYV